VLLEAKECRFGDGLYVLLGVVLLEESALLGGMLLEKVSPE
jgi:hypothetical protein